MKPEYTKPKNTKSSYTAEAKERIGKKKHARDHAKEFLEFLNKITGKKHITAAVSVAIVITLIELCDVYKNVKDEVKSELLVKNEIEKNMIEIEEKITNNKLEEAQKKFSETLELVDKLSINIYDAKLAKLEATWMHKNIQINGTETQKKEYENTIKTLKKEYLVKSTPTKKTPLEEKITPEITPKISIRLPETDYSQPDPTYQSPYLQTEDEKLINSVLDPKRKSPEKVCKTTQEIEKNLNPFDRETTPTKPLSVAKETLNEALNLKETINKGLESIQKGFKVLFKKNNPEIDSIN